MTKPNHIQQKTGSPTLAWFMIRLLITLAILAVMRLAFQIPIPGTGNFIEQMFKDGVTYGPRLNSVPASLTVGALAIVPWLIAASLGQLLVIFRPKGWTYGVTSSGFVDPFGLIILLATIAMAYVQASGVAHALDTMIHPYDSNRFQWLAIAALMAGTSGLIVCAWVIERFGIGRGFWVTLAALSVVELVKGMSAWFELMQSGRYSPVMILISFCMLLVLIALIVFTVISVRRNDGEFEFAAWPLLLGNILFDVMGVQGWGKLLPEALTPLLVFKLITLTIATYVLMRRNGRPDLFLPILGVVAVVEVMAFAALNSFSAFVLPFPLPTGAFFASVAVLTVLAQQVHRQRAPAAQPAL